MQTAKSRVLSLKIQFEAWKVWDLTVDRKMLYFGGEKKTIKFKLAKHCCQFAVVEG